MAKATSSVHSRFDARATLLLVSVAREFEARMATVACANGLCAMLRIKLTIGYRPVTFTR